MNRVGNTEHDHNAWLVERNLRQRAVLLSFFASLLLLVNLYPIFQIDDLQSQAVVSLEPSGDNGSWQLSLVPQESVPAKKSIANRADSSVPGATPADDCSIPPEYAPFFALAMDINRAQPKDLGLLPGIGPTLGHRIVAERDKNGPYESPQALLRVAGIGPYIFAELGPHVCTR